MGLVGQLLVALELVGLKHILPVLHYDILLVLVGVGLAARCCSFLRTYARVVRHMNLVLSYLGTSCSLRLCTRHIVHVNFVNVRLVATQIFL